MTVTYTPLCSVKQCPAPKDPDWHIPVCGHGVAGEHQHFPKRSQAGKAAEIVAFLCHDCHMETDSGLWHDGVYDLWGERHYFIQDVHGLTLVDIQIVASAGTRTTTPQDVMARPSAEANLIGPVETEGIVAGWAESSIGPLSPLDALPLDLTYDQWVAWGEMLGRASNVMAWRLGEWLAYGEDRSWGQKYTEGMHATGKSYSTLSTYVSTVRAFKSLPTASSMSMSVLTAIAPVARSEPEKAQELILMAQVESWTGEDARAAVASLRGLPLVEPEMVTCDLGFRHKRKE